MSLLHGRNEGRSRDALTAGPGALGVVTGTSRTSLGFEQWLSRSTHSAALISVFPFTDELPIVELNAACNTENWSSAGRAASRSSAISSVTDPAISGPLAEGGRPVALFEL